MASANIYVYLELHYNWSVKITIWHDQKYNQKVVRARELNTNREQVGYYYYGWAFSTCRWPKSVTQSIQLRKITLTGTLPSFSSNFMQWMTLIYPGLFEVIPNRSTVCCCQTMENWWQVEVTWILMLSAFWHWYFMLASRHIQLTMVWYLSGR